MSGTGGGWGGEERGERMGTGIGEWRGAGRKGGSITVYGAEGLGNVGRAGRRGMMLAGSGLWDLELRGEGVLFVGEEREGGEGGRLDVFKGFGLQKQKYRF